MWVASLDVTHVHKIFATDASKDIVLDGEVRLLLAIERLTFVPLFVLLDHVGDFGNSGFIGEDFTRVCGFEHGDQGFEVRHLVGHNKTLSLAGKTFCLSL